MAKDIYFRTAFSGYNKSDVISFIERLNEEQIERVNDLNDRLRSSQTENKKLLDELNNLKIKCEKLEEKTEALNSIIALNEDKAAKYDNMQNTYANIMLEAEHTSAEKIKHAEENAKSIIAEAEESKNTTINSCKTIVKEAQGEFASLVAKLLDTFDDAVKNFTNE